MIREANNQPKEGTSAETILATEKMSRAVTSRRLRPTFAVRVPSKGEASAYT